MKVKSAETEQSVPNQTIAALQRKIAAAKKRRSKLFAAIEENPSEDNQKKLARLETTIERNSDTLNLMMIAEISATFETLIEVLPAVVESQDEEELLRLGDETFAAQILQKLRTVRNNLFDSTMLLSADETVKEFLRRINEAVSQGEEKIAEKRRQAAARFPELARQFRRPDYEMPADYHEMLDFLVKQIEKRDKTVKNLKNHLPQNRKEVVKLLSEMDAVINEGEEKLAAFYENYQKKQQYLEGLRKMMANASKTERHQMREHLKENPGQMPDVEKMMREEFPAEADERTAPAVRHRLQPPAFPTGSFD